MFFWDRRNAIFLLKKKKTSWFWATIRLRQQPRLLELTPVSDFQACGLRAWRLHVQDWLLQVAPCPGSKSRHPHVPTVQSAERDVSQHSVSVFRQKEQNHFDSSGKWTEQNHLGSQVKTTSARDPRQESLKWDGDSREPDPAPSTPVRAPPSPPFNQPPQSSATVTLSNGAEQGPYDFVFSDSSLRENFRKADADRGYPENKRSDKVFWCG